jgi:hypothetical protein
MISRGEKVGKCERGRKKEESERKHGNYVVQ